MGTYQIDFIAPGPSCTQADLHILEQTIGKPLPGDYASYLLKHNGAQPVILGHEDDGSIIVVTSILSQKRFGILFNTFIPLKSGNSENPTILDTLSDFKAVLPDHTIPIGRDPGSGLFLIAYDGYLAGSILFWGRLSPSTEGRQLAVAAPSFSAFIESLQPAPDDWDKWESENL